MQYYQLWWKELQTIYSTAFAEKKTIWSCCTQFSFDSCLHNSRAMSTMYNGCSLLSGVQIYISKAALLEHSALHISINSAICYCVTVFLIVLVTYHVTMLFSIRIWNKMQKCEIWTCAAVSFIQRVWGFLHCAFLWLFFTVRFQMFIALVLQCCFIQRVWTTD